MAGGKREGTCATATWPVAGASVMPSDCTGAARCNLPSGLLTSACPAVCSDCGFARCRATGVDDGDLGLRASSRWRAGHPGGYLATQVVNQAGAGPPRPCREARPSCVRHCPESPPVPPPRRGRGQGKGPRRSIETPHKPPRCMRHARVPADSFRKRREKCARKSYSHSPA